AALPPGPGQRRPAQRRKGGSRPAQALGARPPANAAHPGPATDPRRAPPGPARPPGIGPGAERAAAVAAVPALGAGPGLRDRLLAAGRLAAAGPRPGRRHGGRPAGDLCRLGEVRPRAPAAHLAAGGAVLRPVESTHLSDLPRSPPKVLEPD